MAWSEMIERAAALGLTARTIRPWTSQRADAQWMVTANIADMSLSKSSLTRVSVTTDFRITSVDGPDDDAMAQRIAPPEGKSAAEIRAEIAASELPAVELAEKWRAAFESTTEPTRFSLGEMLAVVTIVSLAMAGVRWLPPPLFAGIVGFAMFGWLIWLSLWSIEARVAKLIWWSLLVAYLLALVISFVTVLKS
jgi:hypothetical protein